LPPRSPTVSSSSRPQPSPTGLKGAAQPDKNAGPARPADKSTSKPVEVAKAQDTSSKADNRNEPRSDSTVSGNPSSRSGRLEPERSDRRREDRPSDRGSSSSSSTSGGFDGGNSGFAGEPFGPSAAPPRKYKTPAMPPGMPGWFTGNDKDGDGQVGMDEWPRDQLADFTKYDRNGDGFITIQEAQKYATAPATASSSNETTSNGAASAASGALASNGANPPAGAAPAAATSPPSSSNSAPAANGDEERLRRTVDERYLSRYDRNKDGKLDKDEIQSTMILKYDWERFDANKNAVMEMEELVTYVKSTGGAGGGPGGRPVFFGGPGGPGGERRDSRGGDQRGGEDRTRDFIARIDKNNDGKLSVDEWPQFMPRDRFGETDTNKDGFVDAQEMRQSWERMRSGGARRP
jgi:Ca2+-binding EF-hand superfamily protein